MHYILCPRCHFRVALNKHLCSTCGYNLSTANNARGVNEELGQGAKAKRGDNFWAKFFGLEPPDDDRKDPTKEEPALG